MKWHKIYTICDQNKLIIALFYSTQEKNYYGKNVICWFRLNSQYSLDMVYVLRGLDRDLTQKSLRNGIQNV